MQWTIPPDAWTPDCAQEFAAIGWAPVARDRLAHELRRSGSIEFARRRARELGKAERTRVGEFPPFDSERHRISRSRSSRYCRRGTRLRSCRIQCTCRTESIFRLRAFA